LEVGDDEFELFLSAIYLIVHPSASRTTTTVTAITPKQAIIAVSTSRQDHLLLRQKLHL
jgi:hypothetical protein